MSIIINENIILTEHMHCIICQSEQYLPLRMGVILSNWTLVLNEAESVLIPSKKMYKRVSERNKETSTSIKGMVVGEFKDGPG